MGYETRTIEVDARLSKHNDWRDLEHERQWAQLRDEIKRVCAAYADIDAQVF